LHFSWLLMLFVSWIWKFLMFSEVLRFMVKINHAVYTRSLTHLGWIVYKYTIHSYRGISRVIHLCTRIFVYILLANRTLQQKALRESSNSNQRLQYIYTIYIAKALALNHTRRRLRVVHTLRVGGGRDSEREEEKEKTRTIES